MPEVIDYNNLSETEFLRSVLSKVLRHLSNIDNTLPMMRNGHFIDAYNRIGGTKEGLENIRVLVESRILNTSLRGSSEKNTNV